MKLVNTYEIKHKGFEICIKKASLSNNTNIKYATLNLLKAACSENKFYIAQSQARQNMQLKNLLHRNYKDIYIKRFYDLK